MRVQRKTRNAVVVNLRRLADAMYTDSVLSVISGEFKPIVVNNALTRRGKLTGGWLIAFISRLNLRQNMRFSAAKCEKVRREEIR